MIAGAAGVVFDHDLLSVHAPIALRKAIFVVGVGLRTHSQVRDVDLIVSVLRDFMILGVVRSRLLRGSQYFKLLEGFACSLVRLELPADLGEREVDVYKKPKLPTVTVGAALPLSLTRPLPRTYTFEI